MSDDWWKSDPVAQPQGRTGYIPGVPKAKDPLDIQAKTLDIQKSQLEIEKQLKDQQTGGGTGEQGMAAGFYGRALYANQRYGKGIAPRGVVGQTLADTLPTGLVNTFTSAERQDADAFSKDFVAATLRKESGAAISPEEYQNQYARYFPMPGDAQQTIADKARLRDTAIASLRNQAGPAADAMDQKIHGMVSEDAASKTGDIGFNTPSQPKSAMSVEQQHAYDAWLLANPHATPDQLRSFAKSIGLPGLTNAEGIIHDREQGRGVAPASTAIQQIDPRAQAQIKQDMQQSGGAGTSFIAGAADTAGLGFSDEVGAGIDALGQSLSGKGSFGDNYNVNLQANRGYQQALQDQHGGAYLGGQLLGGALLPVGEVSGAADLAKAGAAYGGAYGAGSGDTLGSRLSGAASGAAAGGATGAAFGKLGGMLHGNTGGVPDLVDPATGALNQPLEAMRPGQRVQAANQFGIDLPMDAAGGRSAAIVGKGLDLMPGSAGVMEDARRGTEQQVAGAVDRVASQFGSARTLNEAGAELQRGANERIDRGKNVISKAYQAIPISDATPAANSNTVATLQQLTGRFQSNPALAESLKDPKLAGYLDAIQNGGLSWKDLKDFRSLIGEKIGDFRLGEGHSTQDLRALYAGLSEDMRNTAAAQGPRALNAFNRANDLNRNNEQLVQGALSRILGKDGQMKPEQAASTVKAMTMGGKATGDLKTLAQIRSATAKSGAWDEIASTLIRLGGQPANSAGRDFSPQTFVNWYSDMSEPARQMLFKPELRTSLDQFVAVNQRLMKVNALRNSSNTAGSMTAVGSVGALIGVMMNPALGAKVAGAAALNYGMGKVWTSPGFVRWATGFARAQSPAAARSQIGRLAKLATTNPELREPLVQLQQKLLSAVNDNVTPSVAASQPNQQNQN